MIHCWMKFLMLIEKMVCVIHADDADVMALRARQHGDDLLVGGERADIEVQVRFGFTLPNHRAEIAVQLTVRDGMAIPMQPPVEVHLQVDDIRYLPDTKTAANWHAVFNDVMPGWQADDE